MTKNQYIKLGECRKPHGIKGGFSLYLENAEDSILKKGSKVLLKGLSGASCVSQSGEEFKVKSITFGNKTICYFEDVADRNKVEAMLPFELLVDRSLFPNTEDGEYYICDLVDLDVRSAMNQEVIGKVKSYFDNGFQVVLSLNIKGKNVELPFVDSFFPDVDLEEGYVTVILPEYT